jgi:hypothetical protein
MLLDTVRERIATLVPALGGRVEGAAELTELVRRDALPNVTPAAFVLPLGLRGGEADAAAGLYRQVYDEVIGVLLVIEVAGDATGATALPTIDALVSEVIAALIGWAPGEQVGVFRLERGQLVSLARGTVIYQLEFSIEDQLRVQR